MFKFLENDICIYLDKLAKLKLAKIFGTLYSLVQCSYSSPPGSSI